MPYRPFLEEWKNVIPPKEKFYTHIQLLYSVDKFNFGLHVP